MKAYYLSRSLVSVMVGLLLIITGSPWWVGLLAGFAAFGWFLAAPHIGQRTSYSPVSGLNNPGSGIVRPPS